MNDHKEALLVCIVGLVFAGLAFLVTAPQVNPYLATALSPMVQMCTVIGAGGLASLLFGLYRHWMNNFFKVRLFLAPLAGCAFAAVAYYLTSTSDSHWTIYSIVNLVEPSVAVQKAFTLLGFGAGAMAMLFLGPIFFKPRFFASFVLGNLAFALTGWAFSVKVLPLLVQTDKASTFYQINAKLANLLSTYGLSAAIFAAAFVFFFVLMPAHHEASKQ